MIAGCSPASGEMSCEEAGVPSGCLKVSPEVNCGAACWKLDMQCLPKDLSEV